MILTHHNVARHLHNRKVIWSQTPQKTLVIFKNFEVMEIGQESSQGRQGSKQKVLADAEQVTMSSGEWPLESSPAIIKEAQAQKGGKGTSEGSDPGDTGLPKYT
jgi:hypothetical protein